MSQSALILGASGRFGRNATKAFNDAGWCVIPFDRQKDDLSEMARVADVIVYGWNPTYDRWQAEVPEQLNRVISAARAANATILFPGNVYVYGKTSPEHMTVGTRHAAENLLGRIRVDMEETLRRSGVKTIILRAGDFLDTEASGNWFDMVIAKNIGKGGISYPGDPAIPHAWAYLPDFARAFVELAEIRGVLPEFTTLNFSGYTLSGEEIADMLGARVRRMNWLPIKLLTPFWPMARRLLEMRYLWNMPHRLDGAEFDQNLPGFQNTPVQIALGNAVSFQINPDQPMVGARITV